MEGLSKAPLFLDELNRSKVLESGDDVPPDELHLKTFLRLFVFSLEQLNVIRCVLMNKLQFQVWARSTGGNGF